MRSHLHLHHPRVPTKVVRVQKKPCLMFSATICPGLGMSRMSYVSNEWVMSLWMSHVSNGWVMSWLNTSCLQRNVCNVLSRMLQPIPLGVTFSNALSKLKAQSSNVSFHWNVAKETFELWALSFRKCQPKWDWPYVLNVASWLSWLEWTSLVFHEWVTLSMHESHL